MARSHAMTPKRKAALRKAQLASARKRRGKGKGKLAAANRKLASVRRKSSIAVLAVGGLGMASVSFSGAYLGRKYVNKTLSGGPQLKKGNFGKSVNHAMNNPTIVYGTSPELSRVLNKHKKPGRRTSTGNILRLV